VGTIENTNSLICGKWTQYNWR